MSTSPLAYKPVQIWLHWIVVVGIALQIAFHEPMVRVMDALRSGKTPDPGDSAWSNLHVSVGTIIMLAVLARLWLRFRHGAPRHAPGTPPLAVKLSSLVHAAFYLLLLSMVTTGILTKNEIANLGSLHFAINVAIVILTVGHAGAAIYNQFIRKDGTLARMIPWLGNGTAAN